MLRNYNKCLGLKNVQNSHIKAPWPHTLIFNDFKLWFCQHHPRMPFATFILRSDVGDIYTLSTIRPIIRRGMQKHVQLTHSNVSRVYLLRPIIFITPNTYAVPCVMST